MSRTHNQDVLALLMRRPEGVTALEALHVVGSYRLAARIYDLRAQGHRIITDSIETASGARIARYRLLPSAAVPVVSPLRPEARPSESPVTESEQRALWGDR